MKHAICQSLWVIALFSRKVLYSTDVLSLILFLSHL